MKKCGVGNIRIEALDDYRLSFLNEAPVSLEQPMFFYVHDDTDINKGPVLGKEPIYALDNLLVPIYLPYGVIKNYLTLEQGMKKYPALFL